MNKIPAVIKFIKKKVKGTPKVVKKKKNDTITRIISKENTILKPAANNNKELVTN